MDGSPKKLWKRFQRMQSMWMQIWFNKKIRNECLQKMFQRISPINRIRKI